MLEGKLVNMRQIKKSDLNYIKEWINDLEVQYYSQEQYPMFYNWLLIKHIYGDGLKGRKNIFIMEDKSGNVIGELWLYPIDFVRRITELVIIIGKKDLRGKGYGKDAINTIKRYCFDRLKLEAIYLKVFSFNSRAINCYKACGFNVIGKGSKEVIRGGKKYYELIMEVRKDCLNSVKAE